MKQQQGISKFAQMFITEDGKNYAFTFSLVCILFLLWGLCNGMIDVLNKHFQNSLGISKAQSAFVQAAWYGAYFLMAVPSGWIARKFGYKWGILSGLFIVLAGSLLFVPITRITGSTAVVFSFFLAALFVVASGLTFLETIANPYTTVLGPVSSGVARINLAQSLNAVGWILGPVIGGSFILSNTETINTSNDALYQPYLLVAGIVAVIITVFIFAPIPDLHAEQEAKAASDGKTHEKPLYREMHFVLAILSQFLYVAAQTGIFSFFINYVRDYMPAVSTGFAGILPEGMTFIKDGSAYITERGASMLLAAGGFGLFLAGRFTGSMLLRRTRPHITLGFYALANIVMMIIVIMRTRVDINYRIVAKLLLHVDHVSDQFRPGDPGSRRTDKTRVLFYGNRNSRRIGYANVHGMDCRQLFHENRIFYTPCLFYLCNVLRIQMGEIFLTRYGIRYYR